MRPQENFRAIGELLAELSAYIERMETDNMVLKQSNSSSDARADVGAVSESTSGAAPVTHGSTLETAPPTKPGCESTNAQEHWETPLEELLPSTPQTSNVWLERRRAIDKSTSLVEMDEAPLPLVQTIGVSPSRERRPVTDFSLQNAPRGTTAGDEIGRGTSKTATASTFMQDFFAAPERTSVPLDELPVPSDDEPMKESKYMLHPDSKFRIAWLIGWCFVFCVDIWCATFQFAFLSSPWQTEWIVLEVGISSFFIADIVLNFFTGIYMGNKIVMERRVAAQNYLKTWFCLDVIAVIPFSIIAREGLDVHKTARGIKGIRLIRVLRTCRLATVVRTYRHFKLKRIERRTAWSKTVTRKLTRRLQSRMSSRLQISWMPALTTSTSEQGLVQRTFQRIGSRLQMPASALGILLAQAHVHAILFGWLQDDWEPIDDFGIALRRYFDAFWWAYCITVFGQHQSPTTQHLGVRVLEGVMLTERLVLVSFAMSRMLVHALIMKEADAHSEVKHQAAIKQLSRHKIGQTLQTQVLNTLQESSRARNARRNFQHVMDNELPQELRRAICEEMWNFHLLSLELIQRVHDWNQRVVPEMAQLVKEEVYASKVVLFRSGETADHAYRVIEGKILVSSGEEWQAPFTKGMWLEEQALIKPGLQRRGHGVTMVMSTLLVVDVQQFGTLLDNCSLRERFDELCVHELWRGFCGRCGRLGDHFPSACPTLTNNEDENVLARDLAVYLAQSGLKRLEDAFRKSGMLTLEQLMMADSGWANAYDLSYAEAAALDPDAIRRFVERQKRACKETLHSSGEECQHCIFISHYKVEAGTEAALMRTELERILAEEGSRILKIMQSPIFLDSEDLEDLTQLQAHVRTSQTLLLLCTPGMLTRPWILVEIWTAIEHDIKILPVFLLKAGMQFQPPGEEFYAGLLDGSIVGEQGMSLLDEYGITPEAMVSCITQVFKRIAVSYSPHRSTNIRDAELREILRQCNMLDGDAVQGTMGRNRTNAAGAAAGSSTSRPQRFHSGRRASSTGSSLGSPRTNATTI